jgi:DNA-binding beta-propeller fold protein YncE
LALMGAVLAALLLAAPAAAAPKEIATITGAETPAESFGHSIKVSVNEATGEAFVFDPDHDVVDRFHFEGSAWKYVSQIQGSETALGEFHGGNGINQGVAVDPTSGRLYVLAAEAQRVFAFEPTLATPSGYEEVWEYPGEAGLLSSIALDPQGELWLAKASLNEVLQVNSETGVPTGSKVEASEPYRVAFDDAGTMYVRQQSLFHGLDTYVNGQYQSTLDSGHANVAIAAEHSTEYLFSAAGLALKQLDRNGNIIAEVPAPSGSRYFGVAVDATHHRVLVADSTTETSTNLVRVFALPAPLSLNVTGNGEVECEVEAGGPEPCGSYVQGTELTLIGTPEPGSILAGWIGCKKVTAETCEVTITESTEVTAVFLEQGTQGNAGPQGPAGSNGASGSQGTAGPQGPAGPQGLQGKEGPLGKVTCQVKQKGKKVKVTCTVKQDASASRAQWHLLRAGRVYRHGLARHGRLRLGALRPGHYRLVVEGQKGATEIIVG